MLGNDLTQIARYAYRYVPIYSHLAEEMGIVPDRICFEDFPVVDKSLFLLSGMSAISSQCISDYISKRLIWGRTSGSTGKCSEVYWRKKDNRKSLLGLWMLRKKYYGIQPSQRMVYFYPYDEMVQDVVRTECCMAFSRSYLCNHRMQEMYKVLLDYDPEWMIIQPSLAMVLCDLAYESGRVPESLNYIEFTGEFLETAVRRRVEAVFQCQTANQYGTKEVNSIAYECPCGNLHIMSDNVYVETIGEVSDEGELCVTSLHNFAMPFVRFNLQDRGRIIRGRVCGCGKNGDVLELAAGRSNDWIACANGEKKHAYILLQIIERINMLTEGAIAQYRIIQKTLYYFQVVLVLADDEFREEIIHQIQARFQERLGEDIDVEIQLSSGMLPDLSTGKLACFISECGEGKVNDNMG